MMETEDTEPRKSILVMRDFAFFQRGPRGWVFSGSVRCKGFHHRKIKIVAFYAILSVVFESQVRFVVRGFFSYDFAVNRLQTVITFVLVMAKKNVLATLRAQVLGNKFM